MGLEHRKILADYWLEKAGESLASAQDEYKSGRYSICVNRLYYAVFYSVSAALAVAGKKYGKHSAVRAAFNLEYIKAGAVPEKYADLYNGLFDDRNEGDYKPFVSFNSVDVSGRLSQVEEFIGLFKGIVHKD